MSSDKSVLPDQIKILVDKARFLKENDAQQAVEFYEKALSHLSSGSGDKIKAQLLRETAVLQLREKEYKKALQNFLEAISIFKENNEANEAATCTDELGDLFFKIGDYNQALEKRLEVLSFFKTKKDKNEIAQSYNKVGELYKFHTQYRKALDHHFSALKLFEETGNSHEICTTHFYIGNCYNWVNELDVAKNHLEKSLQLAVETGDPQLKVKPMGSLAILYTKEKNYVKSLECFHAAIDTVKIINNKYIESDLLKSLGKLYLEIKQPDKAIDTLQLALDLAEEIQVKFPTNLIHQFLSDSFSFVGEHEKALVHFKKYMKLCKEINNEEIALKMASLQLNYDVDELKKEKEIAERSNKIKDKFLSGISHELRTPLNGITGMVNLLNDTGLTPEQSEYVNTIKLSANNLVVLINDMFDYSKISEGTIQFDQQEFKLKELLTNIVQITRIKADEKKLKLVLLYDENIPNKVTGDALRLNQVLLNLLGNAIKHTEKGTVTLEVQTLSVDKRKIKLLFKVTDTGSGIPDDILPDIFDLFTNPQISSGLEIGTGLGLALVKNLIELQGGIVSVSSKKGEGSVFKIELPFSTNEKTVLKSAGPKKASFHPADLSQTKILLVEDNKVNQFLGKQLLSKMGFEVEVSGNAEEAIDDLKNNRYDLVLMDVQMPGMTGYELSKYIREKMEAPANTIPIIALTAYASKQERENAMEAGMNDYLTKPYSPQELLAVIMKHLKTNDADDSGEREKKKTSGTVDTLLQLMGGSKKDAADLIQIFIDQVPDLNGLLGKFITDKKWKDAYLAAHKLKSSIKLLQSEELTAFITELEENTRNHKNLELIGKLFDKYVLTYKSYHKVLSDALPKLKQKKGK